MRILLDSSYFFPYFNVEVQKIPNDFLLKLMQNSQYEIMMSEISFIELTAKCMNLSFDAEYKSTLQLHDITRGNDSLRHDTRINKISWYNNPKILEIAYELRKIHKDFFDCIIFATAIIETDGVGTFDETIFQKIKNNKDLSDLIKKINPQFEFRFYNFQKPFKYL